MLMLQRPEITQEELGKNRTQFVIEPLEPGFGLTLGNTMRRALLSRVPGVAVTGIKIDGVNPGSCRRCFRLTSKFKKTSTKS